MTSVYSAALMLICAAIALSAWTTQATAATLFFDSFEEGPAYPGRFGGTESVPDNFGYTINGYNGWTVNTAVAYQYDPNNNDVKLPGTTGDNVQGPQPDGGQSLYTVSGSSVTNTPGLNTVAGTTYTLSVRIGDGIDGAGAGSADLILLFNGSPVATATGSAPLNSDPSDPFAFTYSFGTLTTSFVALTSGDAITIKLDNLGPANVVWFDAVQLDAEAAPPAGVPEPSTFVLSALGLAGLGLVGWRRRRSCG
ncbi:MAG: PEP-CTERM sorting domain-containing protein [Planctomycetia bacterium]|nr:PEP-CTERM sorting domain-containing protein [Planctomycetia bacterium]